MSQASEPTTGEIVRALRYCADVNSICGDACPAHIDEAGCRTVLMQNAADRLESQEQTIAALTARAESAEAERDAAEADCERAIKAIYDPRTCHLCFYYNNGKGCKCPPPYEGFANPCFPKWRGLQPQEGEGK